MKPYHSLILIYPIIWSKSQHLKNRNTTNWIKNNNPGLVPELTPVYIQFHWFY